MKAEKNSDAIVLEPEHGAADACVIWLHGLGADGGDFVPVVGELGLSQDHRVRFVFPHAPMRPITINQGYEMRGWYDITSLDVANRDDAAGIADSGARLHALLDAQVARGIASERIIVAGFSQGGAIALYGGLRYPRPLGGIIALSSYLPMPHTLADEASEANRGTPVFMAHGTADNIVALPFGMNSRERLRQAGYAVEWHDYPMAHSVCTEEIGDIGAFLRSRLG